jgi:hypothetical protein
MLTMLKIYGNAVATADGICLLGDAHETHRAERVLAFVARRLRKIMGPRRFSLLQTPRDVETHRATRCPSYDACLDLAVRQDWKGWSCQGCAMRQLERERAQAALAEEACNARATPELVEHDGSDRTAGTIQWTRSDLQALEAQIVKLRARLAGRVRVPCHGRDS